MTGFLHSSDGKLIPMLDNFYHALGLLRTHEVEKMKEAKALLTRLFEFQTDEGALPIYLHEYPHIRKPLFNFHFLLPLFYIAQKYKKVVDLSDQIAKLEVYLSQMEEVPIPLQVRMQAFQKRLDLDLFAAWQPTSSMEYAEKLIVAQMAELDMPHPEIWHSGLQRYIGPYIDEPLEKGNLLDEFMGAEKKSLRSSIIFRTFSLPECEPEVVALRSEKQFRLQFSHLGSLVTFSPHTREGDELVFSEPFEFYLSKEVPMPTATAFELDELNFGPFRLRFQSEERVLGHVSLGMRPYNNDLDGPDWRISMTPKEGSPIRVLVSH